MVWLGLILGSIDVFVGWLPGIIKGIGWTGRFAGASFVLAMGSDVIALSTAFVHLFYVISQRIYSWQVHGITSLFTLFRGMFVG
jgi:hypothetical protein